MDTIFIGIISDKNVEISLKIILITYIIIILVFADLYVKSRLSIYFLCLRIEQRCCSGCWASWLLLMQRAHYIWIPWLVWRRLASFLRFHYMCICNLNSISEREITTCICIQAIETQILGYPQFGKNSSKEEVA